MTRFVAVSVTILCLLLHVGFACAANASAAKRAAVASIDQHSAEIIHLSDQVWEFAETALRERRSAKLLADYAQTCGT